MTVKELIQRLLLDEWVTLDDEIVVMDPNTGEYVEPLICYTINFAGKDMVFLDASTIPEEELPVVEKSKN